MRKHILWILSVLLTVCLGTAVFAACGEEKNPTTYTVTYSAGVADEDITVPVDGGAYKEGDIVTVKEAAEREDYTFKGWRLGTKDYQPGEKFMMPANDVTLTAQWEAIIYNYFHVTYVLDGGSYDGDTTAPTESDKHVGSTFTLAAAPEKEGYEFLGWSDGDKTYAAGAAYTMSEEADLTFTAQWAELFSVTYELDGGDYDGDTTAPTEKDHKEGDSFTLAAAPAKSGYQFVAWVDGDDATYDAGATFKMPAKNVTFTATWRIDGTVTYAVTYELGEDYEGEDSAPTHAPAAAEEQFTLAAAPTWEGYRFLGWYDDENKAYAAGATFTMPMHAVTFTAHWAKLYAVTYDLGEYDGSEEAPASSEKIAGEKFNLPEAPAFAEHHFKGWSDGKKTYAVGAQYTMPAEAVAFTAVWQGPVTIGADGVVSDIIIGGSRSEATIFYLENAEAGLYTINVVGSGFMQESLGRAALFNLLVDDQAADPGFDIASNTEVNGKFTIDEDAISEDGVVTLKIYSELQFTVKTITLTKINVIEPNTPVEITIPESGSITYTLYLENYWNSYYFTGALILEGEGAENVTVTTTLSGFEVGELTEDIYRNTTFTFSGAAGTTFTAAFYDEDNLSGLFDTLELDKELEVTFKPNNDGYMLKIRIDESVPAGKYVLEVSDVTYIDSSSASPLGTLSAVVTSNNNAYPMGGGMLTAYNGGSGIIEIAQGDTINFTTVSTTLRNRTFTATLKLTEFVQSELEVGEVLDNITMASGFGDPTAVPLAASVTVPGMYTLKLVGSTLGSCYIDFTETKLESPERNLSASNNYTVTFVIPEGTTHLYLYTYDGNFANKAVSLLLEVASSSTLEKDETFYNAEIGTYWVPTAVQLGTSVTPGTYSLKMTGVTGEVRLALSSSLNDNPEANGGDLQFNNGNKWTREIILKEGTTHLYIYAFSNQGSYFNLYLEWVSDDVGADEDGDALGVGADNAYTLASSSGQPKSIEIPLSEVPGSTYTITFAGNTDTWDSWYVYVGSTRSEKLNNSKKSTTITIPNETAKIKIDGSWSDDLVITLVPVSLGVGASNSYTMSIKGETMFQTTYVYLNGVSGGDYTLTFAGTVDSWDEWTVKIGDKSYKFKKSQLSQAITIPEGTEKLEILGMWSSDCTLTLTLTASGLGVGEENTAAVTIKGTEPVMVKLLGLQEGKYYKITLACPSNSPYFSDALFTLTYNSQDYLWSYGVSSGNYKAYVAIITYDAGHEYFQIAASKISATAQFEVVFTLVETDSLEEDDNLVENEPNTITLAAKANDEYLFVASKAGVYELEITSADALGKVSVSWTGSASYDSLLIDDETPEVAKGRFEAAEGAEIPLAFQSYSNESLTLTFTIKWVEDLPEENNEITPDGDALMVVIAREGGIVLTAKNLEKDYNYTVTVTVGKGDTRNTFTISYGMKSLTVTQEGAQYIATFVASDDADKITILSPGVATDIQAQVSLTKGEKAEEGSGDTKVFNLELEITNADGKSATYTLDISGLNVPAGTYTLVLPEGSFANTKLTVAGNDVSGVMNNIGYVRGVWTASTQLTLGENATSITLTGAINDTFKGTITLVAND